MVLGLDNAIYNVDGWMGGWLQGLPMTGIIQ